jgi:peptide/nickel transport system substrate-binding protein
MRKALLVGTMGVLLALLVAACGGSSSGGSISVSKEETKTANAACEEEPVAGGSLVYARQQETISLDPRETKSGNGDIFADEMLYTGLVRNDPNGTSTVVPGLAEKWDISKDGRTYTFHLRPGLKFSDGSPVTAEDVVWNLEQFVNPEINVVFASLAVGIKSVEAPDEKTVVVKLEHPIAALLYNLAIFPATVVDGKKLEEEGPAFWKHPVGTGPFILKELASGSHITFEKNPYYFEKGKPYLQTMRWNFVSNSNTRVLALKSGEAQMADYIPFSQIESLQSEPDVSIQQVEVPQSELMVPNTKVPALNDAHVRRAMSLVMNREEFNEAVFRGVGTIPNSVLQNFELNASPQEVPVFEYNLAKAKEEMAKSKFPKGFSVSLKYPAGLEYFDQLMLLVQHQLAEIGIKVKLEEQEGEAAVQKWVEGEFELVFLFTGQSSDVPVPDEYAAFFALPEAELNGFNTFWTNKEAEKLVKKFLAATNEKDRKAEWKVIQELFNEEMPSVNLMDFPFINGHQSNVCGTKANGMGVDQLQETWIVEKSS